MKLNLNSFHAIWQQQKWGLLGVLLGTVGVAIVVGLSNTPIAPPERAKTHVDGVSEVVGKHLGWAEAASQSGVKAAINPIRQFFAEARVRTNSYAEEVLGFSSKWKLVTDYVSGSQEHEAYLQERFGSFFFTPEELEELVNGSIDGYLSYLRDVDGELLVRLQADLEGIPLDNFSVALNQEKIQQLLQDALRSAAVAAEADLRGMVGREVVSMTAGEILSVVGLRLMTSAGILSAGASSGAVTFGAGLAAGIAADFVVTEFYNQVFDPVGELGRQIDVKLSEVEALILEGTDESPGLESFLQEYGGRRSEARQQALDNVFRSPTVAIDLD